MDLLTYIADTERRKTLAHECGTSPEYLWQVASGWRGRRPGLDLVSKITAATDGAVTRQELRPDVFCDPPAKSEVA